MSHTSKRSGRVHPRAASRQVVVRAHQDVLVWRRGRADAPIDVWFHPALGDSELSYRWAFESELTEHARVFVHDPPGHGASPSRSDGLTISKAVRLWRELIGVFSESRRVVLIGHSMAGIIASRTAAILPRQAALVIGVEGNLTRADAYFTGLAAQFDEPEAFYASLRSRIRTIARENESAHRFACSLEFADPLTIWKLGRSVFAQRDPGVAFRKLRCPKVHYWDIAGASQETRDYVAQHGLPNRVLSLGHWPMIQRPSQFYAAITADIRKLQKQS